MLFINYEKDFNNQHQALDVENWPLFSREWLSWDGPRKPQSPRWSVDWIVLFQDDMFFRVREQFEPFQMPRVSEGYRDTFSFHYGPKTGLAYGSKPRTMNNDDTIIRIDKDQARGPHLCYNRENHIKQYRVKNISIEKFDLFKFVRAVIKVRDEKCSFQDALGFEIDGQVVNK